MTTMQVIGVGWRAARAATRQARAERRTRSGAYTRLTAVVVEHGLAVAGLGCFAAAAAMIAVPLGLAVAGVALFILEWRVGE